MYPDFVCIGAPKAGTTWLFDNLRRHPRVWAPPLKSIQYFSGRANAKRWNKLRREYRRIIRPESKDEAKWFVRYFLIPFVNEHWYGSLFPHIEGKITGEFAPAYTACDYETVSRIRELMPNLRVIFFMRNPIDRAWSHAVLSLAKNRNRSVESVPEYEFVRSLSSEASTLRSTYSRTLKTWRGVFGKDKMLVRFFEEISDQPFRLLEETCGFLDIDFERSYFAESAERNIFKGVGKGIPPNLARMLADRYIDEISTLNREFGGYTDEWLKKAIALRGETGVINSRNPLTSA